MKRALLERLVKVCNWLALENFRDAESIAFEAGMHLRVGNQEECDRLMGVSERSNSAGHKWLDRSYELAAKARA